MSPDPRPAPGAADEGRPAKGRPGDLRRKVAKVLRVFNPVSLARRLGALEDGLAGVTTSLDRQRAEVEERLAGLERRAGELASALDARAERLEGRLDAAEEGQRRLQGELEQLRDGRLPTLERRGDAVEAAVSRLDAELAEVRGEQLPAALRRFDVLVDRLAGEIEELASLVERQLLGEPLPVPAAGAGEAALAGTLAEVQPALLAAFRGGEEEIRHRLEDVLEVLRPHPPVLDLGCGRGELLGLLREAGVEAGGVEGDPALAAACRRRGLTVFDGAAGAVLAAQPPASWGAVTAFHLLEHLQPAALLALLHQVRRVLQPGGLLVAECPNPLSLRVGGSLYWLDPTHQRPLLPETLILFLEASGFTVDEVELRHPFPDDQLFASAAAVECAAGDPAVDELASRLSALAGRLDDLLNGPRDFRVRARVPVAAP